MKTFLDRMAELKNREISGREVEIPIEILRDQAMVMKPPSPFREPLARKETESPRIIAEVKARAPGRENVAHLDAESVARDYDAGGAAAISVLTDESWFGGSLDTLREVSQSVSLPLMHKEFIISEYQVLEGRTRGASASLILAYYFSSKQIEEMIDICRKWNLEPVVECSLEEELPRVLDANPNVLMINNRPIAAIPEEPTDAYQQGSLNVTLDWWNRHDELQHWKSRSGKILISASFIDRADHVQRLKEIPCDACLIGNAAMTAPDRIAFLRSLMGEPKHTHPKRMYEQSRQT